MKHGQISTREKAEFLADAFNTPELILMGALTRREAAKSYRIQGEAIYNTLSQNYTGEGLCKALSRVCKETARDYASSEGISEALYYRYMLEGTKKAAVKVFDWETARYFDAALRDLKSS